MKKLLFLCFIILAAGCTKSGNQQSLENVVNISEKQTEKIIQNIGSPTSDTFIFPRTFENEELKIVGSGDWTSGFFAGNLWQLYELTGNEKWKKAAVGFTIALEKEQWNSNDHDIGFKMFCSYGNAIKFCDEPQYRDVLIQSAKTLSTRYSPVVGCIRSWNSNPKTEHWKFPVIIDNMMNLELLMWAAKETGNSNFREIAVKHAQTTLKNHFRDNYSCYHVVDYDPETGEVLAKNTHQGSADESDWSRGQAWALYGFTMMYRETQMEEFLTQARNIAGYLLSIKSLKDGKVPYWDFNAPGIPNEPYDASAAAVIASALYELYGHTGKMEYLSVADKLLETLSSPGFLADNGENGGFILKHSTGSKPFNSEIDVPLVYADYYFLESIIRKLKIEKGL